MPTTTVEKTISKSLKLLGIRNPTNEDKADMLEVLNDMLGNWSINNLAIYVNTRETLTLVVSQGTYTIGPSGDLNTTRPETIVDIYLRDATNGQDHFLEPMIEQQYNDIIDKTVQTIPSRYFYAAEYPLGKLYLDYLPDDTDTLLITSKKPFSSVTLADSFILPNGYDAAIKYNLAVEAGPILGYLPDAVTVKMANDKLKDVKRKNARPLLMTTKGQLPRNKGRRYNIYTGDFR
jgi:hypothetical protein